MKTGVGLVLSLSLALGVAGAAKAQSGCELAAQNADAGGHDILKSAATGAAIGGALGGLFSKNKNRGENAALGAALGGLAGTAVGAKAKEDRKQYTQQSAYLECEIGYTQTQLADRQQALEQAQERFALNHSQVERLKAAIAENSVNANLLRTTRLGLTDSIESLQHEVALGEAEIQRLEAIEAKLVVASPDDDASVLEARKRELTLRKADLTNTNMALAGLRNDTEVLLASLDADAA